MEALTFNGTKDTNLARGLLVIYLNTGTKELPVWSVMGRGVEDSSMEMDWGKESKKDILDKTYNTMKKPIITQSLDPWDLVCGDLAQEKLWNLAIHDQDAQALANQDVLVVHSYVKGTALANKAFAERYESCSIEVTKLGGAGGGNIAMPTSITYGGTRTVGEADNSSGQIKFTPAG